MKLKIFCRCSLFGLRTYQHPCTKFRIVTVMKQLSIWCNKTVQYKSTMVRYYNINLTKLMTIPCIPTLLKTEIYYLNIRSLTLLFLDKTEAAYCRVSGKSRLTFSPRLKNSHIGMADPVTLTELQESNNKQLTTALYLIL